MEYFGEAIVRFCWIDLKMKNKKVQDMWIF